MGQAGASSGAAHPGRRRMTANLQTGRGLTVKEAAALMNVSERPVYSAGKIRRLPPDLVEPCERGEMTINKALRIAEGKPAQPNREERHERMATELRRAGWSVIPPDA